MTEFLSYSVYGDRSYMRLGEERMAVCVVPDRKGPVEAAGAKGKVCELGETVQEEEHGDGVGGQLVHIAWPLYQVYTHEGELCDHEHGVHGGVDDSESFPPVAVLREPMTRYLHQPDQRP